MSFEVKPLNNKAIKNLVKDLEEFADNIKDFVPKKGRTAKYSKDGEVAYIVDNKHVVAIEKKGYLIPSIKLAKKLNLKVPIIKVDTGAIKFVTNGADVMRPGITSIDDTVLEGKLVLVVEEEKNTPLCFGIAMHDAVDMKEQKSGKSVKTLHYVRDQWWIFPN